MTTGKDRTPAELNQMLQGYLPGLLGIEMVDMDRAAKTMSSRMAIEKHHTAPNGFLHAASVVALADSTCGRAAYVHLPEGASGFTTIELKSNFLGTALTGALLCTATAQHIGRTTQVWDAVVSEESSGKTLALFRCTQMILWPKAE